VNDSHSLFTFKEKYSVIVVYSLLFLQCFTGVLPTAEQILQAWKSKSPGIAFHSKTNSCYPNGAQKYGEQTRQ